MGVRRAADDLRDNPRSLQEGVVVVWRVGCLANIVFVFLVSAGALPGFL